MNVLNNSPYGPAGVVRQVLRTDGACLNRPDSIVRESIANAERSYKGASAFLSPLVCLVVEYYNGTLWRWSLHEGAKKLDPFVERCGPSW